MAKNKKITYRKPSYTFFSVMMFIAGIAAIIAAVIIALTKARSGDASGIMVFAALILLIFCGVLEIITGIASLSDGRAITNQHGCVTLAKASLIVCLIAMIISLYNGILVWQLAAQFVLGILIPILYLFVSKRGRIRRPAVRREMA